MNYKLVISNEKIYREIKITENLDSITFGTNKTSDIRLAKALFPCGFNVSISKSQNNWKLTCSDGVFVTFDNQKKFSACPLKHNDHIMLKSTTDSVLLLDVAFYIDFENVETIYDLEIDISEATSFSIGGNRHCEIKINDEYVDSDYISLTKTGLGYNIEIKQAKYGVYLNGNKIESTSQIKHGDFLSIAGYYFYFNNNKLLTTDLENLTTSFKTTKIINYVSEFKYPHFSRSTRFKYEIPQHDIEIQKAPPKPEKRRTSFLLSLLPSLAMLALVIVLRGIMSNTNFTFVLYSICSMTIGIIASIASFILDKKHLAEDIENRKTKYLEYIEDKKSEIAENRKNELRLLNLKYTSLRDSISDVLSFDRRIFERNINDDDFLDVWLGKGKIKSNCPVVYSKDEFVDKSDELSTIPEQMAKDYTDIDNAPVIAHIGKSNCVGIVGETAALLNISKNIILDIAIRHFYEDVKMFFWINENDLYRIQWIKWLQHSQNTDLNTRNIMCDESSRNILLEYLFSLLTQRKATYDGNEKDKVNIPHIIVFVFDAKAELMKHPISKFFENCVELGVTFIFFEKAVEYLPLGCNEIINIQSEFENGAILSTSCSDYQISFAFPRVSDAEINKVVQTLSGIYVDEISLESDLTKNISMFELLGIMSINDLDLSSRWSLSKVYSSMSAPLGVKKKGEIVSLDISDKASAHGPHGLVAGTTGSGKSEILQTYVLSMASLFHPYDVGFVIIDFKGGGMANQFKNLPHLIGTITNIDGREIDRSLLSIKAELIKRQEIFSSCNVNHINDYIKLFKQGKVNIPIPHLIMIVDEFAELKAEYPDFMKEIISAARIGRTLGIHLILATQKPSGVVDNQIWSNSKFKLCLKVQTKEDSIEVIKSPLAAEIIEPGRAYFQVGNNEIFELFQSAYSGAKVINSDELDSRPVEICSLNIWGRRSLVYSNKRTSSNEDAQSQLDTIVQYIDDYCSVNQIKRLPGICLPPIPDKLPLSDLDKYANKTKSDLSIIVGLADDPSQQYQGAVSIDLSSNTYIIGSAQTGKTTFIQTILYQIMCNYTPDEVNVYVADCGNMALKAFEGANHIGGVVTTSEEERMLNLMKLLSNQIRLRKEKLQDKGLGTYKAYLEAGYTDLPQIVLVIDNIAVFREYYPDYDEFLMSFSRDGLSVGISMIVTSMQTNSIGFRVLSNFGSRFAFNCNDSGEYGNLFDRCRILPKDVPGRGLCSIEKRVLEFQAALCVEGKKEIDRINNIKQIVEMIHQEYGNCKAAPIPQVPKILNATDVVAINPIVYKQGYRIPIGLNFDTVDYEYIDLQSIGLFGISGREKSGKTNFVTHMLSAINKNIFGALTEGYIIDNTMGSLEQCSNFGFVKHYSYAASSLEEYVSDIISKLEKRKEIIENSHGMSIEQALKQEPLLLLIIENNEVFDLLTANKTLNSEFNKILKQYRKYKVAVIFSNIENTTYSFSAPEPIKQIRETKRMIVFEDTPNIKVLDIPAKLAKTFGKPITPGDGFLFMNGEICKVKTIFNDWR